VKQSVAVIKKRSGHHEKAIREFSLNGGKGLRIGDPLRHFQGILTGAPRFEGSQEEILKAVK
jgi:circadian clock protein KaiC